MRRFWYSPPEGWVTLALLLIMAAITGWAIDEPAWVIAGGRVTDFLPWAAIGGVLAGFVTAQLGWGRLRAHLAGAVAAALVIPLVVGSVLLPEESDLLRLYEAASGAAVDATIDLVIRGRGSTMEYGHSLILLGLLLWGTGQFASYAVFHHGRAMPAVVSLGTLLLLNMALAPQDQFWLLVFFTLSSLFLLVRMHALDERGEWLRRHIGDPGPLASLTARAGGVFVSVAVVGALALTTTAKSEPLRGAWVGAEDWFVDAGRTIGRYFPFLSNPRGPAAVDFGPSADIGTRWITDQKTALRVQVPIGEEEPFYWRAAVYDRFMGGGWTSTDEWNVRHDADTDLLAGTLETELAPLGAEGRRTVVVTIEPDGYRGGRMVGPGPILSASTSSMLVLSGEGGFFSAVESLERGRPYTVSAQVLALDEDDPDTVTAYELRAAGTDYPAEIRARYLAANPDGAVGPEARAVLLEAEQLAQADAAGRGEARTPYDLAVAMVQLLHDSTKFEYSADISGEDCGDRSIVECFAYIRKGFCEYYASTAAVLLREAGIPTRYVKGFLPGERGDDGVETLPNSASHAWIEVYFPAYGWVMFDPTGGGLADDAPVLPQGSPVPRPSVSPRPTGGDSEADPSRPVPSIGPGGGGPTGGPGDPGTAPFIVIGLLLAGGIGLLAFAAYRRGPREVTPDGAWRSVTGVARRLGFGPRPTQTVYEYSAALGDVLPAVRPELATVARAKVEVAYGHRQLGADRIRAVKAATARLRIGLLRLAFRRRWR
jgi:transglutaminase-like putative cysteine protease